MVEIYSLSRFVTKGVAFSLPFDPTQTILYLYCDYHVV